MRVDTMYLPSFVCIRFELKKEIYMKKILTFLGVIVLAFGGIAQDRLRYSAVIIDMGMCCSARLDSASGYVLFDTKRVCVVRGNFFEVYKVVAKNNTGLVTVNNKKVFFWLIEKWQYQRINIDERGQMNRVIYMRNNKK